MNEATHTISFISLSKSSSSLNMSNNDLTSYILNERETRFTSRSIRHQEIFEPQPGNFGSMDRAHSPIRSRLVI